ncbi:uncharacterized protein LOC17875802 [Capsella rubella]|nr:uncharacterized protein LOC17875802 [Capsella rubella]
MDGKYVRGFDVMMEEEQRNQELKDVETRMKEFIGEKTLAQLKLRELIALEKKLETLQPNRIVGRPQDVRILKNYINYRLGEMETKIYNPKDEFDVVMEAKEAGHIKGLKMRLKVFIDEEESENISDERLIEFRIKLEALQPKEKVDVRLKVMKDEVRDIILMKEIVKILIGKRPDRRSGSSSRPKFINNYCV